MPNPDNSAAEAEIAQRLRQAVLDLNQVISDADRMGLEADITIIEHQAVASPRKRQMISARLVRPVASA